jgi:hypothetical protein
MTILYRTVGPWGAGIGRDLNADEVDGNFYDLEGRMIVVEAAVGKTIDFLTIVGDQLTVTYTDHTTDTVTVPFVQWNWRIVWEPSTDYVAGDTFSESNSVYIVLFPHTSDLTFDPAANDGHGNDFYGLMLAAPTLSVPVLTQAGTTFTPTLSYADSYVRLTNAAGCAVSIPANADQPFAIGTELHFRDDSTAGDVTFDALSPAIINGVDGYLNESERRGGIVTLKKVATDAWDIFGLLRPIP